MKSVVSRKISTYSKSTHLVRKDHVVVEEPLEVFVNDNSSPLLVTMRTPGDDESLVLGLLYCQGLLSPTPSFHFSKNTSASKIRIKLQERIHENQNVFIQNSSCGLCNKSSWEDVCLHSIFPIYPKDFQIHTSYVTEAISLLSKESGDFQITGGCHKIILTNVDLKIISSAEDVGRHNAFDKVIGQCIKNETLPLRRTVVLLSGRCSYEMTQKAWLAGIPVIISLGAPSSKAIDLAESVGITLIGFAKRQSFNVYSHPYRIRNEES